MIKIFAKYGTDEKIAIWCHPAHSHSLIKMFNTIYGEGWACVDECSSTEFLKFADGRIYQGFDPEEPKDYRYTSAVNDLKKLSDAKRL